MTSDKQDVQADGSGTEHDDGRMVASRQGGIGESGGGAYPNPHSDKGGDGDKGKKGKDPGSFFGHGGQSEIGYTGGANPNATAKGD